MCPTHHTIHISNGYPQAKILNKISKYISRPTIVFPFWQNKLSFFKKNKQNNKKGILKGYSRNSRFEVLLRSRKRVGFAEFKIEGKKGFYNPKSRRLSLKRNIKD